MNPLEKLQLIAHVLRWRFTWSKRNLDYKPPEPVSSKFITAREAAALIPDGACVVSSGIAGNARCSAFYWAVRESFLRSGKPRDLTWMNIAAQGGRGKVPGTVEEIAIPGLMKQYIAGHLETAKAQLRMCEAGQLQIHTMPQGVMSFIFDAQSRGENWVDSDVGIGTFIDPRHGGGTAIHPNAQENLVSPAGELLRYTLPKMEVALFCAPYADADGNIYFHHAATLSENLSSLRAARINGGKVMVTVSGLIPKDPERISLHAEEIDYVVVHPYNEQTATIRQRRYWPAFSLGAVQHTGKTMEKVKFINHFLKITPVRNKADYAAARLGAMLFAEKVPAGSIINIGVGYPEELARMVIGQGLGERFTFTTEAGAYGGLPAPGIFFGAAVNPEKLISSTEMFRLYQERLGACVLGFLQVDSEGNVNATLRGRRIIDTVGPGGFPDIARGARRIFFIGAWMDRARFRLDGDRLVLEQPGKPKFVDKVDQVTFSAREALRLGKEVYYITHTGAFQLTPEGLRLMYLMPGIDLKRDVLDACSARILLPEGGEAPLAPGAVVSGRGFRLG